MNEPRKINREIKILRERYMEFLPEICTFPPEFERDESKY